LKPALIRAFIEKTGISEETLVNMSLINENKAKNKILNNPNALKMFSHLWITSWRDRTRNGLRYCPECLKTDSIPYYRKSWRLGYVSFCPIHNCLLENDCPSCKSPLFPYRLKWDQNISVCYKCGANLTDRPTRFIPAEDPLLIASKSMISESNKENIYKILALAWFIACHCTLSDFIFANHPLALDIEVMAAWKKRYKLNLFSKINTSFLIFGTAFRLFEDKEALSKFLGLYYSCIDSFWTIEPFYCPFPGCGKKESDLTRIKLHIQSHSGLRPHQCSVCGKNLISASRLKQHLQLHTEPHPFVCPVASCGQKFRHEKDYIHHIRLIHQIRPYKCPFCERSFYQKPDLDSHQRIHTGERPYTCEICGKSFTQTSAIRSHRFTHTGERPYICDYCGKGFTQSQALKAHVRIHTEEEPYKCELCSKKFKRQHHLSLHLRTHTGEKPYKCEKCGKAFSDKGNLNKHEVQHTGKRPFICETCGKAFRYKTNLNSHMNTHLLVKPYECTSCGKRFSRKDLLKIHKKNKHG